MYRFCGCFLYRGGGLPAVVALRLIIHPSGFACTCGHGHGFDTYRNVPGYASFTSPTATCLHHLPPRARTSQTTPLPDGYCAASLTFTPLPVTRLPCRFPLPRGAPCLHAALRALGATSTSPRESARRLWHRCCYLPLHTTGMSVSFCRHTAHAPPPLLPPTILLPPPASNRDGRQGSGCYRARRRRRRLSPIPLRLPPHATPHLPPGTTAYFPFQSATPQACPHPGRQQGRTAASPTGHLPVPPSWLAVPRWTLAATCFKHGAIASRTFVSFSWTLNCAATSSCHHCRATATLHPYMPRLRSMHCALLVCARLCCPAWHYAYQQLVKENLGRKGQATDGMGKGQGRES